ncbi:hypothetical protein ACS0TY_030270 [Phlomoides rotata]
MTTVYTMKECSKLVQKLMEVDKGVAKKAYNTLIHDITLRRWTRSYCPIRRYHFMTSNIAESLNSVLRHTRKFPVCPLLECIHEMLQRWFFERREKAIGRSQVLTDWVSIPVNKNNDDAAFMVVSPIGNGIYQVKVGNKSHNVNLHEKTCTCRRFDLDQIPCGHAVAVIRKLKLDVHGFCADYCKTENLRQLYSGCIYPVGHPDDWLVPVNVKSRVVLPPITRVPPGKPKGKRVPSAGKRRNVHRQLQVCSRCKQPGHKRVTCTNNIRGPTNEDFGESFVGPRKGKRTRHCSTCGETGHNKKNCPTTPRDILHDEVNHDLLN